MLDRIISNIPAISALLLLIVVAWKRRIRFILIPVSAPGGKYRIYLHEVIRRLFALKLPYDGPSAKFGFDDQAAYNDALRFSHDNRTIARRAASMTPIHLFFWGIVGLLAIWIQAFVAIDTSNVDPTNVLRIAGPLSAVPFAGVTVLSKLVSQHTAQYIDDLQEHRRKTESKPRITLSPKEDWVFAQGGFMTAEITNVTERHCVIQPPTNPEALIEIGPPGKSGLMYDYVWVREFQDEVELIPGILDHRTAKRWHREFQRTPGWPKRLKPGASVKVAIGVMWGLGDFSHANLRAGFSVQEGYGWWTDYTIHHREWSISTKETALLTRYSP